MSKRNEATAVTGEGTTGTDKKKRDPKKIPFDVDSAQAIIPIIKDGKPSGETEFGACQQDGQLFAVPKTIEEDGKVSYQGWDLDKHKPVPKSQFADDATYLEFQAEVATQKANKLYALAEERIERARKIRKFGDKVLQKKAAKLEKMRTALAEMEAELAAEGIDINEV